MEKYIVKRKGEKEHYDERKVYASCYAAALNCEYREKKAERLASEIAKKVTSWIKKKKIVHSSEIREKVILLIKEKDVVLMYKSHLDIS